MSAWHLRAVVLPDGEAPLDLWVNADGVSETPLAGARELPGVYVLFGGLVDAHFHATLDFEERGLQRPELLEANLAALHAAGVLAARDTGQAPDAPWLLDRQGPRFTAARTLLVPPGRYFPGLGDEVVQERLVEVGVAQAKAGAEWVKVIFDFVGPDGNWFAAPANYDADTLAELVRAVHAEGARVAVHSTGPAVADAVRAGVDSIEHGPSLDAATVEEMARRGTLWVPTLWTAESHLAGLAGTPAEGILTAWRERMRELLGLALRLGVPVLAGSDERPAGETWREVAQLVATGGLTPLQALAAATVVPRRALGLPGHPGDLVTYDADPREDLSVLARPAAVLSSDLDDRYVDAPHR
ncbi:amidohydrolase family protein [Solirubrobacter soli]|uniref:amidohydrolase family protein n=1 Tax=Solirubrobacter soli TaxID=363832 RepID=UPI0003FD73C0|nr:amidohydrolase family protein [Solirubrobacter soli]